MEEEKVEGKEEKEERNKWRHNIHLILLIRGEKTGRREGKMKGELQRDERYN